MAVEEEAPPCPSCLPGWLVTFSDMMSLLLTFFILLLTFADMEVKRFRQVAASMKEALGVQRDYVAEQIPMGTSVVMKEFKPGKQDMIDFESIDHRFTVEPAESRELQEIAEKQEEKDNIQEIRETEQQLKALLKQEIEDGQIEVTSEGANLILRIQEKATFQSGSATLQKKFLPLLSKISRTVSEVSGQVDVIGHTDNLPISNDRFRSNWELSTSRAVSVAHALLEASRIDPKRVTILGKGETDPIADNRLQESRARNRRVEVIIRKPPQRGISNHR